MELICPSCRGDLEMTHGRMATCRMHGGQYEVLFDRWAEQAKVTVPKTPLTSMEMCYAHSRQTAVFNCAKCARPICGVCVLEMNGKHYCTDCALSSAQNPEPEPDPTLKSCPMCGLQVPVASGECSCGHQFGLLNLAPPPPTRRTIPANLMCATHPEVHAVAVCRMCSNAVCATCDFEYAGGVHVCPSCVEKGDNEVSPKRRRLAIWSLGLAIYSTFMIALLLTGSLHRLFSSDGSDDAINTIIGNLIFLPTLAGTALGFATYDRKLLNPPMFKAAMIWNCILVLIYMALIFIGLSSK